MPKFGEVGQSHITHPGVRKVEVFELWEASEVGQPCITHLGVIQAEIFQVGGRTDNADTNAAMNIKAAGVAASACGGDVRPERSAVSPLSTQAAPVKQEPLIALFKTV